MDFYYEGVVEVYLRADRAVFVQAQGYIDVPSGKGFYPDFVAVSFWEKATYLCEVKFNRDPRKAAKDLLNKARDYALAWPALKRFMEEVTSVPSVFELRTWFFVPEASIKSLVAGLQDASSERLASTIGSKITPLEMVVPWRYDYWDRTGEVDKPSDISPEMR